MTILFAGKVIFLFTAISLNPADTVDDAQMVMAKNLKDCQRLEAEYDVAHIEENEDNAPAFRLRWTTDCKVLVLTNRGKAI